MKTIIEANYLTVDENRLTIPEKINERKNNKIEKVKEYKVIRQIPASGSEADIFVVSKMDAEYIMKYYRYGIIPQEEIMEKIKLISEKSPAEIVKIYEIGYDGENGRYYEILEYIENGSLYDLYHGRKLEKNELKKIISEINNSLKILHDEGIIHLDLKPSNILVRTKEPLDLVFTDFGISSFVDKELEMKMTSVKGTPLYCSPESFTGVVGKESDYWSLGMIIYELAAGYNPFDKIDHKVIMYTVMTKNMEIDRNIDSEFMTIIKGLLVREPERRWGYSDVVKWLNGESGRVEIISEYNDEKPYEDVYKEKKIKENDKSVENEKFLKNISLENINSLAVRYLKGEADDDDKEVLLGFFSGDIGKEIDKFIHENGTGNKCETALAVLNELKYTDDFKKKAVIITILAENIKNKDKYILNGSMMDAVFLIRNRKMLIEKENWEKIKMKYIIPVDFLFPEKMNGNQYKIFLKFMYSDSSILIEKTMYEQLKEKYILHEEMLGLENRNYEEYILYAGEIVKNKSIYITKGEYKTILATYGNYLIIRALEKKSLKEFKEILRFINLNIGILIRNVEAEFVKNDMKYSDKIGLIFDGTRDYILSTKEIVAEMKLSAAKGLIRKKDFASGCLALADGIRMSKTIFENNAEYIEDILMQMYSEKMYKEAEEIIEIIKDEEIKLPEILIRIMEMISSEKEAAGDIDGAIEILIKIDKNQYCATIAKKYLINKMPEKGFEYMYMSAKSGNLDSLYKVGIMFEEGIGTDENVERAKKIFSVAKDKGSSDAEKRLQNLEGYSALFGNFGAENYKDKECVVMLTQKYKFIPVQRGERIQKVVFSDEGSIMYTFSKSGNVKLWGLDSKILKKNIECKGIIESISCKGIVMLRRGDKVELYDVDTNKIVGIIADTVPDNAKAVFSDNGEMAAIYGYDRGIYVYDAKDGRFLSKLKYEHINPKAVNDNTPMASITVSTLAIPRNKNYLVAGGNFKEIRIWDIDCGRIEKGVSVEGNIQIIAASENMEYIVTYDGKNINVYDSERIEKIRGFSEVGVKEIKFIKNTKIFITMTENSLKIWNPIDKYFIEKVNFSADKAVSFDVGKNGDMIAVATDRGEVLVFDIDVFDFGG